MNSFLSLTLGFLSTLGCFVLSFLCVIGAKVALLALKKPVQTTQPAKKRSRKTETNKNTPSPCVRSIEIDPNSIDRIYVKKIS